MGLMQKAIQYREESSLDTSTLESYKSTVPTKNIHGLRARANHLGETIGLRARTQHLRNLELAKKNKEQELALALAQVQGLYDRLDNQLKPSNTRKQDSSPLLTQKTKKAQEQSEQSIKNLSVNTQQVSEELKQAIEDLSAHTQQAGQELSQTIEDLSVHTQQVDEELKKTAEEQFILAQTINEELKQTFNHLSTFTQESGKEFSHVLKEQSTGIKKLGNKLSHKVKEQSTRVKKLGSELSQILKEQSVRVKKTRQDIYGSLQPSTREKSPSKEKEKENAQGNSPSSAAASSDTQAQDQQERLIQYYALYEIVKKMQEASDLENFWNTLSYAIVAILGAEAFLVFCQDQDGTSPYFYPIYSSNADTLSRLKPIRKDKGLASYLSQKDQVCRVTDIPSSALTSNEKDILKTNNIALAASLTSKNQMYAIMLLNSSITGEEYTSLDLEFLYILSQLSCSSLKRIREATQESQLETKKYQDLICLNHLSRNLKDTKDFHDLFMSYLDYCLGVKCYSLVLLSSDKKSYYMYQAMGITKTSQKKFHLPVRSDLARTLSNIAQPYHLDDFKENIDLSACYSKSDLKKMEEYWILPLLYENLLWGFITIHGHKNESDAITNQEDRLSQICELAAPHLANLLAKQEQISTANTSIQPMKEQLKQLVQEYKAFALVDLRINNCTAICKSLQPTQLQQLFRQIHDTLLQSIDASAHINHLGIGHFALVIPKLSSDKTKKWIKELTAKKLPQRINKSEKIHYTHRVIYPSLPKNIEDIEMEKQIDKMLGMFN